MGPGGRRRGVPPAGLPGGGEGHQGVDIRRRLEQVLDGQCRLWRGGGTASGLSTLGKRESILGYNGHRAFSQLQK